MLKLKIWLTSLALYEILVVCLLHSMRICSGIFSSGFCQDSGFKYFIFCFVVPTTVMLIGMWLTEIFRPRHKHFSFLHHANNVVSDVKSQLVSMVVSRDMDKYLTAAILFGIKKYAYTHPKIRHAIEEIINNIDNPTAFVFEKEYPDEEYEDVRNSHNRYTDKNTHRPIKKKSNNNKMKKNK